MSNPLFNQYGTNQQNPMNQFFAEVQRLQQQFKNPRQEVERLMQSGQMSQADFNRFAQMANQLVGKR